MPGSSVGLADGIAVAVICTKVGMDVEVAGMQAARGMSRKKARILRGNMQRL
jgi:hypothetical protein